MRSGLMIRDSEFDAKVTGGGEIFNMPFWQQLSGSPQAIQSDTTIETKKVGTSKMAARRFLFGRGWSAEEIASALAGSNAMAAIQTMIDDYWNRFFNGFMFSIIKGVIADNVDNDSGDLVKDITTSGTPGSSNKMNSNNVIDSLVLMGDSLGDFAGIGMHSTPYAQMVKNDLIDFIPDSKESIIIPKFMGLNVIVDDGLTADTDGSNSVYWNVLFKPNAIAYGESAANITPYETDRTAADSEDRIFTRRQFTMHPRGFRWIDTSVEDEVPTQSEVEEPGNWDRVFEKKNCGFVVLKTNG